MRAIRNRLIAAGSATALMVVASPAAAETIVQPSQLNTQTAAGGGDIAQVSEQSVGDTGISGGDGQNLVAPSQVNTQQAIGGAPGEAAPGGTPTDASGGDISQGSSQEIGDTEIG